MSSSDVEEPTADRIHATDLEGVAGRLRLDVSGNPVAVLEVHDGDVEVRRGELRSGDSAVDAVATCDSADTLSEIRRGALNPVVAALQNRLEIAGDREFAIKVILGLQETFGAQEGKVL